MKAHTKCKGIISNANINIITESLMFFIVAFAAFGADNFWLHAVTGLSVDELIGRSLGPSELLAEVPLLQLWVPLAITSIITMYYLVSAILFAVVSVIKRDPRKELEIPLNGFHEILIFVRETLKIRPNITSITIGLLASLSISAVCHWDVITIAISPLAGALLGLVHMSIAEQFSREWEPKVPPSAREALMTQAARKRKRYLIQIAVGRRLRES